VLFQFGPSQHDVRALRAALGIGTDWRSNRIFAHPEPLTARVWTMIGRLAGLM
jgi:hypothetical protein